MNGSVENMANTNVTFINRGYMFGKIIQAIFIGVAGSMLLVIFFTGVMSLSTIEKSLPWIIGFNAALTGYNLMNKTGNTLKHRRICSVGAGIVMVIITAVLLDVIFLYLMGGHLIFLTELMVLIVLGSVFSGFGAILAIKYLTL